MSRARASELRAIATASAAAYAAKRAGTEAEVIVIGHDDGHRDGLTEDYLQVELAPPAPPRGARLRAQLERRDGHPRLLARPRT